MLYIIHFYSTYKSSKIIHSQNPEKCFTQSGLYSDNGTRQSKETQPHTSPPHCRQCGLAITKAGSSQTVLNSPLYWYDTSFFHPTLFLRGPEMLLPRQTCKKDVWWLSQFVHPPYCLIVQICLHFDQEFFPREMTAMKKRFWQCAPCFILFCNNTFAWNFL